MANSAQQLASTSRQGVVTLESQAPVYQSVQLMIAGQRLALKTDQDPAVLESMAQEVNACVEEIRRNAPGASSPQIMALALMQLMERARQAEQQDAYHCQVIERHAQRLEKLLASMDSAES
ncbi:MAG: cell division protein ZapA [Proteobacteria bacterium]|jgi:cell division protein ZapA (FtsZ GTPase activity inhibitor)|nr:cell division protein ZapA [Pseudomonadota bacterium]